MTHDNNPVMIPSEVAALFRVDPKTVTRWAQAGKLTWFRTLGGHRRYYRDEVMALMRGGDDMDALITATQTPTDT